MFHLLAWPCTWLAAIIGWGLTLLFLSSLSHTMPPGGPEIPHLDKVMHFTYFAIGGLVLGTYAIFKSGVKSAPLLRVLLPILILAVIGALDEYHQSFTPGRSGNDPYDWLADLLGASFGVLLANPLHPLLLRISSRSPSTDHY